MQLQQQLQQKLAACFDGAELIRLENESHMHNVPQNSETHFKLILVDAMFEGLRKVARHQKVYQLLQQEFAAGLHALAMHLYTPQEWQASQLAPDSPKCLGGEKKQS